MESIINLLKISLVALSIVLSFACTDIKTDTGKTYTEKNHEILKEIVLCHCLYSVDSSLKTHEGSSGFFFNRINYDPQVFYIIDSIIPLYKPKYVGLTGNKLGLAECISLYKSDTLMKEIRKMDRFMAKE
ncbi:MAG: hypothetical protein H7329_18185 [Opitutaceae bacterium]|nr:hypothetical protein [Cytophagales bacterium]